MKRTIGASFLAAMIFASGCVSLDSAAEKQLKFAPGVNAAQYPARAQGSDVDLFFSTEPSRGYDVIGELTGEIVGEPKEVLKARARQVGADAVMITEISSRTESKPSNLGIEQRSRPADIITPTYEPGYSYKVYTVKCRVVKYKD